MISVIIPSYETHDLTAECVKRIKFFEKDVSEIIVVDDFSKKEPTKQLLNLGPKDKLIINKENKRYSCCNNLGAENAENEILCFFNNDFMLVKPILSGMVPYLSEYGMVSTSLIDLRYGWVGWWSYDFQSVKMHPPDLKPHILLPNEYTPPFLIKKELFNKVKFDEELNGFNFEDVDFCWRLMKRKKIIVFPFPLLHVGGATILKKIEAEKVSALIEKNKKRFHEKWK